jgi:TolB-like protein/Tfp pilus assembly protein PilF
VGGPSEAVTQPPGVSATAGSRTVFLSYASPDAVVANQVCEFLESHGVSCWMAPRDVKPGAAYADAIVRAINEASALVLVLSGSAMASEHVSREVERAGSKHKPIVAFRVDAAALSAELEYFLSRSQWIDVLALGMATALVKLVEAVGREAPSSSQGSPELDGGGASGVNQAKVTVSVARRVVVAAVIIILSGVGGLLVFRFWPSKRGEPQVPSIAAVADKSIAVLPFTDMSEKHDQEYFADGMAEEILDLLVKIPGLRVIGRTSSFQFKGKTDDLRKIGDALGAAFVVEGSVRRSGDHMRVTAQLIDAKDGEHRWSNTYDAKTGDVFEVQDAIAVGISRALELTMTTDAAQDRSVAGREAYDLYLRGLHALDSSSKDGCEQAIELFTQLLHLQPNSKRALVSLAWAHDCMAWGSWGVPGTGLTQAREFATQTLLVDPKSAEAHLVLANVYMEHDYDWTSAQKEIDVAFHISAPDARALRTAARLAGALGQFDRSLELLTQALALDPLDPSLYDQLGDTYARAGQFAKSEEMYRRCLQIAPRFVTEHFYVSNALLLQGRLNEALVESNLERDDGARLGAQALIFHALQRKGDSDAALMKFIETSGTEWPSSVARVFAFRGERDQALAWLDKAYQQRDVDLYYIKGDPLLKNLAGDSRFKAFLRKMNLPE